MSQLQTEVSTPVSTIPLESEVKLEATITIPTETIITPTVLVKRTRKSAKKMESARQAIIAGRQAGLHRLVVINNLVEQFGLTQGSATMYYYKYEGPKVTPLSQD